MELQISRPVQFTSPDSGGATPIIGHLITIAPDGIVGYLVQYYKSTDITFYKFNVLQPKYEYLGLFNWQTVAHAWRAVNPVTYENTIYSIKDLNFKTMNNDTVIAIS